MMLLLVKVCDVVGFSIVLWGIVIGFVCIEGNDVCVVIIECFGL